MGLWFTSLVSIFPCHLSSVKALLVSLGDPIEVPFPMDTVELVALVSPEPLIGNVHTHSLICMHVFHDVCA